MQLVTSPKTPAALPPADDDMPRFRQLPNACGLSSLLMALRPFSRGIDAALDRAWELIGGLFHVRWRRREFLWSRVLEYVLLKCVQDNELREKLKMDLADLPDVYGAFVPVLHYNLQEVQAFLMKRLGEERVEPLVRRFYEEGVVYEELVTKRLLEMKRDPELKILACVFGCRFVPWPGSTDGTGSLFFTKEDVASYKKGEASAEFEEKVAFLKEAVENKDPLLLGATHHWLAVKHLHTFEGRHFLTVHDPASGKELRVPLERASERDRFYRFAYDEALMRENVGLALRVVERDSKRELAAVAEAAARRRKEAVPAEVPLETLARVVEIESGRLPEESGASPVDAASSRPPLPPRPKGPLSQEQVRERLRAIIRSRFSDYRRV
ncbi:MAG: hypothetical protein Kow0069_26930 [Promethearchaeota archaeon]